MEQNNVYTSYGECRCCLAKGHHRDVTKEYYFNNVREVYLDIFMECFNLNLSTHHHISPLICSTCVQRLRDATSFRMMVVCTERQLVQALDVDNKETVFVNVSVLDESSNNQDIKSEVKAESDAQDSDGSHPEQNEGFGEYDCDSSKDKEECLVAGEAALLARYPSAPPLPTRCSLFNICPEYVDHLNRLRDTIVKAESLQRFLNKPKINNQYVTEKLALAINATTIFENSNAIAFKTKMRNGYPCFYCRQIYNDHSLLRNHQSVHPKTILFKLLTKYTADCLVVYAEVTDLKCTICDTEISSLNELKSHLIDIHKKKMYLEYSDRVIPFKLSNFECQICRLEFETFGAVERHMNKHYGNYICEECGAGFVTKHRLGIHSYMLHRQGNYPCETCKKSFPTNLKYKIHYDSVHRMLKKNKCPQCPEKFMDYFTRQKHLVEIHGFKPILYKCNVCEKSFNRRYSLSIHIKRCHLEQKDVKCQLCVYSCYTKTELKEHLVKHGGVKEFQCVVCRKAFARKKALLQHMRIHANDRRFSCNVCGLAFVQKCTLKGHMKTHQDI